MDLISGQLNHAFWNCFDTLTYASGTIQMMADQEIFSCASNGSFRVLQCSI